MFRCQSPLSFGSQGHFGVTATVAAALTKRTSVSVCPWVNAVLSRLCIQLHAMWGNWDVTLGRMHKYRGCAVQSCIASTGLALFVFCCLTLLSLFVWFHLKVTLLDASNGCCCKYCTMRDFAVSRFKCTLIAQD